MERVGFVAAEVAKHRGVAICTTISPFEQSRQVAKKLAEENGAGFITVYIATSAEECARRDVKGLYNKAKSGAIQMTGEWCAVWLFFVSGGVWRVGYSVSLLCSFFSPYPEAYTSSRGSCAMC